LQKKKKKKNTQKTSINRIFFSFTFCKMFLLLLFCNDETLIHLLISEHLARNSLPSLPGGMLNWQSTI
jgi:hypothetical protein